MYYEMARIATIWQGINPRGLSPIADGGCSVRCDWCQQQIEEIRYKCLTCPDFDACDTCFRRMRGTHSDHSFIKVNADSDIIEPTNITTIVRHGANCHRCKTRILGVRYVCLHPACRDVNFCQNCEALPGPSRAHPTSHPLVKFREDYTSVTSMHSQGEGSEMPRYNWDVVFEFTRNSEQALLARSAENPPQSDSSNRSSVYLLNSSSVTAENANECPICFEDMTNNEALGANCPHTLCTSCKGRIVAQAMAEGQRPTCHACRLPYVVQDPDQIVDVEPDNLISRLRDL
ncbi:uncharacterized protein EI90DRAFT_3055514 [Cantharellus anzutake]|uniref:uncharacterized protein n=1 Tax=Cantharellus anzutake TaxID=1750568 RepID=UPI00190739D8|nr:uncharacterized protein EI90DRAFT_3055514 [Cantharellus anzutake]KAF8332399.1 hypothetical protein EI90DRAFT_3055514 [Cantharellus anzutake]